MRKTGTSSINLLPVRTSEQPRATTRPNVNRPVQSAAAGNRRLPFRDFPVGGGTRREATVPTVAETERPGPGVRLDGDGGAPQRSNALVGVDRGIAAKTDAALGALPAAVRSAATALVVNPAETIYGRATPITTPQGVCGVSLPRLGPDVPRTVSVTRGEGKADARRGEVTLGRIAEALLAEGMIPDDPNEWGGSLSEYVVNGLRAHTAMHGGETLQFFRGLSLCFTDNIENVWSEEPGEENQGLDNNEWHRLYGCPDLAMPDAKPRPSHTPTGFVPAEALLAAANQAAANIEQAGERGAGITTREADAFRRRAILRVEEATARAAAASGLVAGFYLLSMGQTHVVFVGPRVLALGDVIGPVAAWTIYNLLQEALGFAGIAWTPARGYAFTSMFCPEARGLMTSPDDLSVSSYLGRIPEEAYSRTDESVRNAERALSQAARKLSDLRRRLGLVEQERINGALGLQGRSNPDELRVLWASDCVDVATRLLVVLRGHELAPLSPSAHHLRPRDEKGRPLPWESKFPDLDHRAAFSPDPVYPLIMRWDYDDHVQRTFDDYVEEMGLCGEFSTVCSLIGFQPEAGDGDSQGTARVAVQTLKDLLQTITLCDRLIGALHDHTGAGADYPWPNGRPTNAVALANNEARVRMRV